MLRVLPAAALLALATPALAQTEAPATIAYQGVLADDSGAPVPDGTYTIDLRLFDTHVGGTALYGETYPVSVVDGLFSVQIGNGEPLDAPYEDLDVDRQLWVELTVEGTTLAPRTALQAVPYARSLTPGAVVSGGRTLESVLTVHNTDTGASTYGLHSKAAGSSGAATLAQATSPTGPTHGVIGQASSSSGVGVSGQATAQSGAPIGVEGTTAAPNGYAGYFAGGRGVRIVGDLEVTGDILGGETDDEPGGGWPGGWPGSGLGSDEETSSLYRTLRGLRFARSFAGGGATASEGEDGAGLVLRRPSSWDGETALTVRLWVRPTSERSGTARFSLRVRSFAPGVPSPETASIAFPEVPMRGEVDVVETVEVEVPASVLQGDLWEIVIQRDADEYPDEVLLSWCDVDIRS